MESYLYCRGCYQLHNRHRLYVANNRLTTMTCYSSPVSSWPIIPARVVETCYFCHTLWCVRSQRAKILVVILDMHVIILYYLENVQFSVGFSGYYSGYAQDTNITYPFHRSVLNLNCNLYLQYLFTWTLYMPCTYMLPSCHVTCLRISLMYMHSNYMFLLGMTPEFLHS